MNINFPDTPDDPTFWTSATEQTNMSLLVFIPALILIGWMTLNAVFSDYDFKDDRRTVKQFLKGFTQGLTRKILLFATAIFVLLSMGIMTATSNTDPITNIVDDFNVHDPYYANKEDVIKEYGHNDDFNKFFKDSGFINYYVTSIKGSTLKSDADRRGVKIEEDNSLLADNVPTNWTDDNTAFFNKQIETTYGLKSKNNEKPIIVEDDKINSDKLFDSYTKDDKNVKCFFTVQTVKRNTVGQYQSMNNVQPYCKDLDNNTLTNVKEVNNDR